LLFLFPQFFTSAIPGLLQLRILPKREHRKPFYLLGKILIYFSNTDDSIIVHSMIQSVKLPMKAVFWDMPYTEEQLVSLLNEECNNLGSLHKKDLLLRMIEYMNWYDFIDHVGKDNLPVILTEEFIQSVRSKHIQKGLSFVKEFLLRNTLSASG